MVDKHGMVMHDLKWASGETKWLRPYSGDKVAIYYNRDSGRISTSRDGMVPCEDYFNPHFIHVFDATFPLTMQEIADVVWNRVREVEWLEKQLAD